MRTIQVDEFRYELPMGEIPGMQVPGLVFADRQMMESIRDDGALKQVAQTATLPGSVKYSMAMPDIHFGYGFPIGGVLATRVEDGVISPGGVGFDINCGVRMLLTPLSYEQIQHQIENLVSRLFSHIPTGVGSSGKLKLKSRELYSVVEQGSRWAVQKGFGFEKDIEYTESQGCLEEAHPNDISQHAYDRGSDQLGTLGSGNHFIEIQVVDQILNPAIADGFGLAEGQISVMIHTGSRGLGHQVCTDYLKVMGEAARKYKINLPDRQLACAPIDTPEANRYLGALRGAANYAWANRQCLTHWIREVFVEKFGKEISPEKIKVFYDVAHNIVKFEEHVVDGKKLKVAVHRKGATRAFGPGHPEINTQFRPFGQPVLIPGDMGRASYVLAGTNKAMQETFGSACHGAGRILSRNAAMKAARGRSIFRELAQKGVIVQASGKGTLAEEMPEAYKDVSHVVRIIEGAGIASAVARLRPLGVIKG